MSSTEGHISFNFGPFRLNSMERFLEKDGERVPLGSRALDLLSILVEHNGNIVSKRELTARAWPDTVVDEVSLRVHISSLRKMLGNGPGGMPYITNVSGRGYMFSAAAVSEAVQPVGERLYSDIPAPTDHVALPMRLSRMIGREESVSEIRSLLLQTRFVSIVGVGGLGKTTVAVAVAHEVRDRYVDGAFFVDLTSVAEGRHVSSTIAALLGTSVPGHDPVSHLVEFLRTKNVLLVLDNAEHLVDELALLAERLVERCPKIGVLVTSREALRVEGEHIYNLRPLDVPPRQADLANPELMAYPAVRLFVDRAFAGGGPRDLNDAEADIAAEICRRLDGVALAIELVAGRAATYGIVSMLDLLDHRFGIHWHGRRTALPRHQTLAALHDWSYNLLDEAERAVLRRLGCFFGPFTVHAASAVIDMDLSIPSMIEMLADKSLISRVSTSEGQMKYRLAETTRAYCLEKLLARESEASAIFRAHALYYVGLLERAESDHIFRTVGLALNKTEMLGNIRSALDWCVSERGDIGIGLRLAACAAPIFLELSLLSECHEWAVKIITRLPAEARGSRDEALMYRALAISGIIKRDAQAEVPKAFARAIDIARSLSDNPLHLDLLAGYHIFVMRSGDCGLGMEISMEAEALCGQMTDRDAERLALWLRGISHSYAGEHELAVRYFARSCSDNLPLILDLNLVVFTQQVRALVQYARCLVRDGSMVAARRLIERAVMAASTYGHPIPHCIALAYSSQALVWSGDWDEAEQLLTTLANVSQQHSLHAFKAVSLGISGEMDIAKGDASSGVGQLRDALEIMRIENHHHMVVSFTAALANGLVDLGELDAALFNLDRAIELAEASGEKFQMIDLIEFRDGLRVKVIVGCDKTASSVIGQPADEDELSSIVCSTR